MDKLIAYTPHTGPRYEADNAQVYNLLSKAQSWTNVMTSITRHQCRRNGRSAYPDLFTRNMGLEKWGKTVEQAYSVLANRIWNGNNSQYPLKVQIVIHRGALNDLIGASYQINYFSLNETYCVRYLLTSVHTNDPTIFSDKTTI